MPRFFFVLVAILSFSVSAWGAESRKVTPELWNQLMTAIIEKGEIQEGPGGIFKTLTRREPADRERAHRAEYLSGVGGFDADKNFRVGRIEVVSEDFQINAENHWVMDQWLFVVSIEGQIRRAQHNRMVKTREHLVLEYESLPFTEEEAGQALDQRLVDWAKHTK